jgi:HEPN domain-containing protein
MITYKEIAENDYTGARKLAEFDMRNLAGQHVQQACEKLLKHWLFENHKLSLSLARTHNLRKLLREIGGYGDDLYKTAAVVENFYFDTKYPGDDYIDLTEHDIETAFAFYDGLIEFLKEKESEPC